jgi:hypothetical protein
MSGWSHHRRAGLMPGWSHHLMVGLMPGGLRRRTTGLLPGALRPVRVADRSGERHRRWVGGPSGALRRRWSPGFLRPPTAEPSDGFLRRRPTARPGARRPVRENATFAGSPRRRGPCSALARGPAPMSGSSDAGRRRLASEDHAARRRRSRCHDRCAVLARRGPRQCGPRPRGRRPSGPGRSSRSRWSRSAAGSCAGSSMFRRQHEPSSGHRGRRRYDRRLPLGPWAFRVPQPRQPTSSSATTVPRQTKRAARPHRERPSSRMSGSVLLSHAVPRAVPSALKGLTSGFGMGPGVSPSL